MKPIKVMVIDESPATGEVLSRVLRRDPSIHVAAVESDAHHAVGQVFQCGPDVILLDAGLPRMNSIALLQQIMRERPTPIVVAATTCAAGSRVSVAALSNGAVQVVTKPGHDVNRYLQENSAELIAEIKVAAQTRVDQFTPIPMQNIPPRLDARSVIGPLNAPVTGSAGQIVVIGGSTGGAQTLQRILMELPRTAPGMVVVQHLPGHLLPTLVQHLNNVCDVEVRIAQHGDRIRTGLALLTPAGVHAQLQRSAVGYHVIFNNDPPVNSVRPAIDVLFRSVARTVGKSALGILMTGTGTDGASGLKTMREAGALTLAEDESTCVAQELTRHALAMNAVVRTVRQQALAREIQAYADKVLN